MQLRSHVWVAGRALNGVLWTEQTACSASKYHRRSRVTAVRQMRQAPTCRGRHRSTGKNYLRKEVANILIWSTTYWVNELKVSWCDFSLFCFVLGLVWCDCCFFVFQLHMRHWYLRFSVQQLTLGAREKKSTLNRNKSHVPKIVEVWRCC